MALKTGIFAAWVAVLVPVNAYLIEPVWGQLLFTGVSAGLMTYAQHKADQRAD
ncbi:hypothetical protein [Streptomyces sp. Isolate_45]|uniref:hypothetical protein n=1 Tax=Streptomyces sp. Isolate_45 TaxID=2950111 RepID=UPI002481BDE6|nr:hypothetical protein [Streptomyces sp. Isolate_45]MDA5280973.1 hypothetical protein [Streptomyces sp. Isolate_45]